MIPHKASAKGSTVASTAKKKTKTKNAKVVAKKTDFFDLRDEAVKACWENILGYSLVRNKPILVTDVPWMSDWRRVSPHAVPGAVNFVLGMSELSSKVYFSKNTFHFGGGMDFERWTLYNKESAKLLRKIGVDFTQHYNLDWIRHGFKRCIGLRELSIGIDELKLVKDFLRPANGYQRVDMRPQDITPQLNLLVLRANHMDKLRQLRVPKMTFTPLIHGSRGGTSSGISLARRTTGPIPGGVLERVVAKEIMQATEVVTPVKKTKETIPKLKRKIAVESDDEYKPSTGWRTFKRTRATLGRAAKVPTHTSPPSSPSDPDPELEPVPEPEIESESESGSESGSEAITDRPIQPFRVLDLPAEMRNQIYRHILVHQGPINPSKRIPTTHHRAGASLAPSVQYRRGAAPSSSLALLQTNKQTYNEAVGIYYGQNAFVFYYPNQLMMFLHSVCEERKKYIERVTLWYKNQSQGDIDSIDVNLAALRNLKSLKRLELVLDDMVVDSLRGNSRYGWKLPGESLMKEMAKAGVEVVVRNQAVDTFFWRLSKDPSLGHRTGNMRGAKKAILDLSERIRRSTEEGDTESESDEGSD